MNVLRTIYYLYGKEKVGPKHHITYASQFQMDLGLQEETQDTQTMGRKPCGIE